jgi:hypothetical protein
MVGWYEILKLVKLISRRKRFRYNIKEDTVMKQAAGGDAATQQLKPSVTLGPSAFKILFSDMLSEKENGDWNLVLKKYRKPLKCFVKESTPFFLVTDVYYFVQAYFTK